MGESLSFTAQIAHNGHSFSISALGDSGAGGYIYIDSSLAVQAAKAFRLHTLPLPHPIPTEGYDGHPGRPITHALELTLIIDGRKLLRLPMLITDLGRHDLILGRIWFNEFGVLPDCRKGRPLWPEEPSLKYDITTKMPTILPRSILQRPKQDSQHQEDADRRDRLFQTDDNRLLCRWGGDQVANPHKKPQKPQGRHVGPPT